VEHLEHGSIFALALPIRRKPEDADIDEVPASAT
jgi:hypothetical protein